jgi:hypothetical protein
MSVLKPHSNNGISRFIAPAAVLLLCLSGCTPNALLESAASPEHSPAPAFSAEDRVRMDSTRSALLEMRALLEAYYGASPVLEETLLLGPDHPAYRASLEFLAAKFARALTWQDPFIIGTIGSSVTAGYNNCRSDCYQQQLERLMAPVWAAAGTAFEVRNTGQGGDCGDSFSNQIWCLPALVGDEVDITHYSWTYFEAGAKQLVEASHELYYRWSLMMDHAAAPMLIYTGNCSRFSKPDRELLEAYAPWGANVLCMIRGLEQAGFERGEWGQKGDNLHETTRSGELPGVTDQRRQSLAVVFRNWHPGPLLFQTTADVLAYRYSSAMLLAIDWIDAESDPRQRWSRKPEAFSVADLPRPMECNEAWCLVDALPVCVDFEKPTFGVPGVELLEADNPANPHSSLADAADGSWIFDEGRQLLKYTPDDERGMPECEHPNRCSGWVAPAGEQAGWLTFRLPELELGFIAACCGRKRCAADLLEAGAEFLVDGQRPAGTPEVLWRGKCLQIQAGFELRSSAQGRVDAKSVHLGIRLPPLDRPLPPITHVFGL